MVQPGNTLGPLTLFGGLTPAFSNPGYTFAGWTSNANGSGTSYANGAPYDFTLGSLSLYAQWIVIPTVHATFALNGGSGSVPPVGNLVGSSIALPGGTGMSNPGYTFSGWNTLADGSGVSYSPGATYVFVADQTLYAQWVENTVTFFENATSGDATHAIESGHVIALLTPFAYLSPPFANPGYSFTGWSTSATGNGVAYADAVSYDFVTGSVVLYARWTLIPTEHVSFDANGGTGSAPDAVGPLGSSVALLGATTFARSGYTFVDWNTSALGTGTSHAAGASLVLSIDETFYAQWSADTFTVTYNDDGGSVSPGSSTFVYGSDPLALPTPTYAGKTFTGWFSAASGGTLVGLAQSPYRPTASVVLYAQWLQVTSYTLSFDANGGTGTVASISGPSGSSITLPGVTGLSRPGYTLVKWNTDSKGSGSSFGAGMPFTLAATYTLFAQWTGHAPAVVLGAVGPFAGTTTALSVSDQRQAQRFAALIEASKFTTVLLYGYAANTGLVSLNLSVSRVRANGVAAYLRSRLSALHVKVVVKAAGEGSVVGGSSAANHRVEVLAY